MNITKTIAEHIAKKLTEKNRDKIKELETKMSDELIKIYVNKLPKEVLETFSKFPKFFDTSTHVTLVGHGFNHKRFSLKSEYPKKDYSMHLDLTAEQGESLIKISNEIDKQQKMYQELKSESETALLNLRTFKRVEETFPEAAVFLPAIVKGSLVVNLDSLRNRLK